MKTSIIIPVYIVDKSLVDITNSCLNSVKMFTKNFELIIVDNLGGKQWANQCDIYIKNKVNGGNGTGWYQGAKVATGDVLVFMDNDVTVSKGWLEPLLKILEKKENAVAFPMSMNKEDTDYLERLAGFCWAIRRDLFHEVNDSIDSGYRIQDWGIANFEDTSFYRECQMEGYKLICSDKAKIKHHSRATCDLVPEVAKLYGYNEKKYFNKYSILPLLD